MSDYAKSLIFALILCLVCSVLLTAASVGLRPYQLQNVRIDRQINILKSVGLVKTENDYSTQEIDILFTDHIRCLRLTPSGEILSAASPHAQMLQLYLNVDSADAVKNYIIPINTQGLWGRIKGYLAIDADGETISGFTVYKHSETPGLGGEIEKQWFQKNFEGKKISSQAGDLVSVAVAKGRVADNIKPDQQAHYVDGISGATLTGKYLSQGLQHVLKEYEPISIRFRKDQFKLLPPDRGICDLN
jgi:Na+-transporting NADH:ubiquinone oxidoreductase subunit C